MLRISSRFSAPTTISGHGCLFSPDGRLVAAAFLATELQLWDVATGNERWNFSEPYSLNSIQFAPDGKTLAGGYGTHDTDKPLLRLWDVATGKELPRFDAMSPGAVACIAFSADGKTLAAGLSDHTVRLWDVGTGKERHRFQGHANRVLSVAYAPDGKRLASGSQDGTVLVWDVTGRPEKPQE